MHNIISLMVATAHNNVVGLNNRMPWHLPADLQYFKKMTMGKPLILGRKTWDSIGGRPLPGRPHFVVTRQQDLALKGATVVTSVEEALNAAQQWLAEQDSTAGEIMVIGGGEIYRQTLPLAQRIYKTQIELDVEGDTHFPEFDTSQWQLVSEEPHPIEGDFPAHSYQVWEKND